MQPKRMDQRRRRTAARPRAHLVERFQRCGLTLKWQRAGFFLALWRAGLAEYDEMEGIAWDWQSVEGALVKAPLAGGCVGANPTDREKNGRKRSLLVDGRGVPLSIVASGANVHDVKLLAATLDRVVCARPAPRAKAPQHFSADAGRKGAPARQAVDKRYCRPHIKQRREEADAKRKQPGYKARRWVVERTHSWPHRFRKLLVSFEKTEEGYVALLALAAAMICWRQTIIIYGYALSSDGLAVRYREALSMQDLAGLLRGPEY